MFDTHDRKRLSAKLLFVICAVLGAVCFIGIYGTNILDFTDTGWLFDNDHDLRQHYIGWCAYRNSPWGFPIGLIDSLSYPNSMSVIYTDSIPLFAVIFKLFRAYLPVTFQYFGLFGIVSFMLTGGFSALLLRRLAGSDICCILGSVFYIISAPIIQRMYYHTALAAQWIIIAALVVLVYNDLIVSDARMCAYWALLGAVCVWIHSYFLPMAGMILAALALLQLVRKKGLLLPVKEFASFCLAGLASLYVLGAFYGGTSATGPGIGTFTSNLNTFINPLDIGSLLPQLPVQNYFQYEGMAYLGAGILFLFVIVAAGMVFRLIRGVPEAAFHSDAAYGRVALLLFAVSFLSALLPNISFNDTVILWIPYPAPVEKVLGIFRSNGRFIWTAMYLLMTAAISFTAYTFRRYRPIAVTILLCALSLQIVDMSGSFASRYRLYTSQHPIRTIWDDEELSEFTKDAREFIFMYTDNDITMPTAYYGYLHGMRQNNYYFARDIDDKVREGINLYRSELAGGNLREGAIYVLRTEDYEEDPSFYDRLDADMIRKEGHVMIRARK